MAITIPIRRAPIPSLQRRTGSAAALSVSPPNASLAASSTNTSLSLQDVQDMVYIANVTIGGVSFPVQFDTGSSDLWVMPSEGSLPTADATSTNLNLTYGIGWAYGKVAYASTEFAGITVPQQAFLNVSSANNPSTSYGAVGIMGLSFNSLSFIDSAINQTGSSSGRSLLYSLFHDNPSEPNFIAFSLQSSSDGDDVQGSFSVGETDPLYANVTNTNQIPTWPVIAPSRWNVLLDSFIVGNRTNTVSTTVSAAPQNKAVVLLDSGTSYTYVPTDVSEAIYGGISGAQYDSTLAQWVVPCDVEIDIALQIDNQIFPIHPLDVTPNAVGDSTTCVGSFIPQSVSVGAGQFDWLIGDNVLRSIYTLYDFGDFTPSGSMGNPYLQMLALVDPDQASAEFHAVRGGTANTNITYNVSNDPSGSGSGSTTVSLSTQVATAIDTLSNFLPVILGLIALNTLILIALLIGGIVWLCKRRRRIARTRKTPGRLSPMQMGNLPGGVPLPHTYQPVSMALTEDTLFVPPTPGFKTFSDRPNSIA